MIDSDDNIPVYYRFVIMLCDVPAVSIISSIFLLVKAAYRYIINFEALVESSDVFTNF